MDAMIEGSSSTDVQVATTAASRDADFESWLVAREQWLFRIAYLLAGDRHQAEDLTQSALAKLYLAWDRIRGHDNVDAYARRVLVNEHRSAWRRAWRRREVSRDQLPDRPTLDHQYDGTDAALWEVVATLPVRQRAVVVLRFYEELSEAETAAALGVSVGTVKSQCHRALAKLRDGLADHPEIRGGEQP